MDKTLLSTPPFSFLSLRAPAGCITPFTCSPDMRLLGPVVSGCYTSAGTTIDVVIFGHYTTPCKGGKVKRGLICSPRN